MRLMRCWNGGVGREINSLACWLSSEWSFEILMLFFFFFCGCPTGGGCPSPRSCWAYPRAGPVCVRRGGTTYTRGIFMSSKNSRHPHKANIYIYIYLHKMGLNFQHLTIVITFWSLSQNHWGVNMKLTPEVPFFVCWWFDNWERGDFNPGCLSWKG